MSLTYYMDEHVDYDITRGLRRRNVDVLVVQDDSHRQTDDAIILDRATVLGRVVFTQDKDFLREAHHRQVNGIPFAGVIYAAQDKRRIGQIILELDVFAKSGNPGDLDNQLVYLKI
jgi:predicted nuclease of predicted toxin-antitoxin system